MSVILFLSNEIPGWLAATATVVTILLAGLAAGFMFLRVRPSPEDNNDVAKHPGRYIDPVLLMSALLVIVLAVAAYASR